MRVSFIGDLERISSKWRPTHTCLIKTVFFGSTQINFLTLCPRRELTYSDKCYSLYVWLLNAKKWAVSVSQQNPKSPSIPWVVLEFIIWEGLLYHIKYKIVHHSVLWFFEMGRMASEQMIGLWGKSCSFRSALPRSHHVSGLSVPLINLNTEEQTASWARIWDLLT